MKKAIIIFSVLAMPAISFAELPDGGFNFNDWTTTKPAIKATITKPESSTSSVNYWDTTSVGDGGEITLKPLSWSCGSKCQSDDSGERWLYNQTVNNSHLESVRIFMYLDDLSNKAGCLLLKKQFNIDTKQSGCRWSLVPNFEQKIIKWIDIRDSQIDGMKNSSSVDVIMAEVNRNYGKRLGDWSKLIHTGPAATFFQGVPPAVMKYIQN